MDVLIIYQFCTFGGVERAILNRVQTIRQHDPDMKFSVSYLYRDEALTSFQDYICSHGLQDHLEAFILPQEGFDWNRYDMVTIIDTPQVFDRVASVENVFVECHTAYTENRQYLRNIPKNVRGVLAPSAPFRDQLLKEFPGLPPIHVIPNVVSDEFYIQSSSKNMQFFPRHPVTYFARRDDLKNFNEAVRIFEAFLEAEQALFFVIGYGSDDKGMIELLEEKQLIDKAVLRGRIGFSDAPPLTRLVKANRGIFLSPSKGESFGLSAAEFISAGVPVLLSNIPAHNLLVQGDMRFLYALGDIAMAKEKLLALRKDWDALAEVVASYGEKFRGDAFFQAWMDLLEKYKLYPKIAS